MEDKIPLHYILLECCAAVSDNTIDERFVTTNCPDMRFLRLEQLDLNPVWTRLIRPYLLKGCASQTMGVVLGGNRNSLSQILLSAPKRYMGALLLTPERRDRLFECMNTADGIIAEQNATQRRIDEETRDLESVARTLSNVMARHQFISDPISTALQAVQSRVKEVRAEPYLQASQLTALSGALAAIASVLRGAWRRPSNSGLPGWAEFSAVYIDLNVHRDLRAALCSERCEFDKRNAGGQTAPLPGLSQAT